MHARTPVATLIALSILMALAPTAGAVVRSGGGSDPAGDAAGVRDITAAQLSYDTGSGRLAATVTLNGDPGSSSGVTVGASAGTRASNGDCVLPAGLLVTNLGSGTASWAQADGSGTFTAVPSPAAYSSPGAGQVALEATASALAGQAYNCVYASTQSGSTTYDTAVFSLDDPPPVAPVAPAPPPVPRPALSVSVKGLPKAMRRNRTAKVRVTVRNTGTAPASKVKLALGRAKGLSTKLGKTSFKSLAPGKSASTTARLRLSRRAKRATSINVAASAAGVAKVRAPLALKVKAKKRKKRRAKKRTAAPASKLVGRLFWNFETPMPSLRSPDIEGIVFVNSKYAYFSLPKGGIPRCTRTTAVYEEGKLKSGCVPYRFNERTGALRVAGLRGSYRKGKLVLGDPDIQYQNATLPKAGARYDAKLVERTYFGLCGLVTGCTTTLSNLVLSSNGQFVLSNEATSTSGGTGTGVPYTVVGNYPPDKTGTYRILSGARIEFRFANGTVKVQTIAIDHNDKTDKPDIAREGLLLDDGWYYFDDD